MSVKKTIDIEVTLENGDKVIKQFEDLGNGVLKLADSSDKLEASFEEVYNGMQPLTTRMGEAEDRLYELALAGDTTSKEYQELLTKVGEYRKVQIQTDLAVDQAAQTFSQKLGTALGGATSGFAAVQGVMALTGGESEALEKSLLKVQGALAIQQGIQGVLDYSKAVGLATKATRLWGIMTGTTTGLFKALRVALISTGIGAIVVGIGLLIANFDKLIGFFQPVIDGFKAIGDFIGITNFAEEEQREDRKRRAEEHAAETKRQEELDKRAFDARQQQYDNEIALMEALGKSSFELRQQKLRDAIAVQEQNAKDAAAEAEYLEEQMKMNNAFAKARQQLLDEQVKKLSEANLAISSMQNQLTINEIKENDKQVADEEKTNEEKLNAYKQYLQNRKDAARKIEDLQNQLMEDGLEKELELNRDNFRRQREDLKAQGEQKQEIIDLLNQLELKKEIEIQEKFRQQRLKDFTSSIEPLKLAEDAKTEIVLKGAEKRAEGEKKISKELADYRVMVATQSLTAINDIAELFSKGSEKQAKRAFNIQKAVGIAQATINTAQAITKVFAETTDFTPTQSLRIANAVAIGVAGAAQVASIASQTFEGGGGGETPSVSASGGEAQAPSFNVVGDSGINQLAQLQQAPVQAFVVSGEVTTSQALDRNRVENATL